MNGVIVFRAIETRANQKGDLFARLIGDLFYALGYDGIRLNVHKTGREIDIVAKHRTEARRLIAECKAWGDRVGGDKINKFVGALDAEKSEDPKIEGYFVSLSGFTESALEQERQVREKKGEWRLVLLDGNKIVDELVRSRILISADQARGKASAYVTGEHGLSVGSTMELLLTDIGLVWVIYFMRGGVRTHISFVHADGDVLSEGRATTFRLTAGVESGLEYNGPRETSAGASMLEARTRYLSYLSAEFGDLQTTMGIPTDEEIGSRRLRLESIFVPLHLEPVPVEDHGPADSVREAVGSVLHKNRRLAILGPPGSGKTTLLQRIAIAYGFPERRGLVDDNLPNRPWLPVFVKCRHLDLSAKAPLMDIIISVTRRAEMHDLSESFAGVIREALKVGQLLLLVDGFDEITDEGLRLAFVRQLRVFLAIYPTADLILTSREAGFRIVGNALAEHCAHYRMADFDAEDVKRLCRAWYREVAGDRQSFMEDADSLSVVICESDRLLRLARNPLLLTTLLLIKRWIGQLPTRRSVLYGKAIEVLLMTWNTEGHDALNQEEAIPQLAFVAFTMMEEGIQRVPLVRLKEILSASRKQMPDLLAYSRLGINEFLERVELRSSILMVSGYVVEDGRLQPVYEFRHLTFQEYLTALALVDGYYPDRKENDTLLTLTVPNLRKQNWREVIPLAAVLAGRRAAPLLEHLCHLAASNSALAVNLLGQCVLDEVPMSPRLLRTVLAVIARHKREDSELALRVSRSRYGEEWRKIDGGLE